MATQEHTTSPASDPIMRAYDELGLSCADLKGWSLVLKHMSGSPHMIEPAALHVLGEAIELLSNRLEDEREWFLRHTGRRPPMPTA